MHPCWRFAKAAPLESEADVLSEGPVDLSKNLCTDSAPVARVEPLLQGCKEVKLPAGVSRGSATDKFRKSPKASSAANVACHFAKLAYFQKNGGQAQCGRREAFP